MKTIATFIFALAFSWSCIGQQNIYFVASNGNDQHDGHSQQTAWKTLSKINGSHFSAGDKILLEGGSLFIGQIFLDQEDKGSPVKPITIGSFGEGKAIIQNNDSTAVKILNTGGIVIKNLVVKSNDATKNKGSGIEIINTIEQANKQKFIRVENCIISGFGNDGIWLGGKPVDRSQSGFEDVIFSNCEVFNNRNHGIFVTGVWDTQAVGYANKTLRIENCVAHDNTGDPLFLENHSGSGMEIDNVEDALIEYCSAYNNGYLCNSRVGGPCGIWLHAANNSIIQYCTAINNRTGSGLDGAGFDLDGGTTNCIIQNCYARDNDGAGILVWNYDQAPHRLGDNIIRHNILENNGRKNSYGEIHIGTSGTAIKNMTIENNTIFSSRQPGTDGKCIAITYGENNNFTIQRNVFISNGVSFFEINKNQQNLTIKDNTYWSTISNFVFKEGEMTYSTFTEWQKQTNHEINAGNSTATIENPFSLLNSTETPSPKSIGQLKAYQPANNSQLVKKRPLVGALPFK
jgi:hypothetical protein